MEGILEAQTVHLQASSVSAIDRTARPRRFDLYIRQGIVGTGNVVMASSSCQVRRPKDVLSEPTKSCLNFAGKSVFCKTANIGHY